jgi:hypothetical protein
MRMMLLVGRETDDKTASDENIMKIEENKNRNKKM